jgi:hypothetical protein
MKQQESGLPMVLVIGGIVLVAIYPFLIKIKNYFFQKFNEISTAVNNFTNYIDTHRINVLFWALLGLVVIYVLYRIIKSIKNKIKNKKEKTSNLKHEAKEIEKILNKKLDFDYKETINFIEQIKHKIKVSDEFKKLSIYHEPLKDKLEKAKSFLECIEYEEHVNYLNQKKTELDNEIKKLEKEDIKVELEISKEPNTRALEKSAVSKEGFIDVHKGFFKHNDLKLDDVKYLVDKGYKEYNFKSITGNKKELYLLKPDYNESPQHFFLICDIENYIKTFTNKVQTFNTAKPDVIFKVNDKNYAIEVETGRLYERDKKKLFEKIKTLKKEYPKRWFFVVTNKHLQPKYAKLGETCTKLTITNKISELLKNV